jgi:hypothetical protein
MFSSMRTLKIYQKTAIISSFLLVFMAQTAVSSTSLPNSASNSVIHLNERTSTGDRELGETNEPDPSIDYVDDVENPDITSEINRIHNQTPILISITPSSGLRGTIVNVTLSGGNFRPDANVSIAPLISGPTGITISDVFVVNSTTITARFTVAADAVLGDRSVRVTNPLPTFGVSNTIVFSVVNPIPNLSAVSPNSGQQGTTVDVVLTGSFFVNGATVGVSGTGITVTSQFVSSTRITARFTIALSATTGGRIVSVTNPGPGGGTNIGLTTNFTVTAANPVPTLSALSPTSGAPGRSVNVTLTGTNFIQGSQVLVSGLSGITVGPVTFVSSTQLTAEFNISAGAALGSRNVVVRNPSPTIGPSNPIAFSVVNPRPILRLVQPNSGQQGTQVDVVLTGSNFVNGATVQVSGTGITVTSQVVSSERITARFTIALSAATGGRRVSVTNPEPGGGTTIELTTNFTVTAANPVPTLSALSPTSGAPGRLVNVTLTGTNFIPGSLVFVSGSGITVGPVTFVSSTQLTAEFNISASADLGSRNVIVGNPIPGGGVSNTIAFSVVNPRPTLSSVSPNIGQQGTQVDVVLTGSNFVNGATVGVSGTGITVTSQFVSSTRITARFTIALSATTGGRIVSVTNPSPGGGTNLGDARFTVTAANPVPTLSALSPNIGGRGQLVTVRITGTNFIRDSQVNFTGLPGVVVNAVEFVNSTTLDAIFAISSNAAFGVLDVKVRNPSPGGGESSPLSFSVQNPAPILTSITPSGGTPGSQVDVTLIGSNFLLNDVNGVGGSRVVVGNGVTATNVRIVNSTTITATFSVASDATLGSRSVFVQNPSPGGGISAVQTFNISQNANPTPVLNTLSPLVGLPGQTVNMTLTGSDFVSDLVTDIFIEGDGITVLNKLVVNPTTITAQFVIAPDALSGERYVTVTNRGPGGGISSKRPFTVVNPMPMLTLLSPNSSQRRQMVEVTLTGSNFVPGATVQVSGSGVRVPAPRVTVVNSTTITAEFDIAGDASLGSRSVTVTNPAPGGGTSESQTFTVTEVQNPVPVLTSISPISGQQGQTVQVTLTGSNFVPGATLQVSGSGVIVPAPRVTVVNSTTITAEFVIAGDASLGDRNVTVTNPAPGGGTSESQTFTVTEVQNPVPVLTSISPNSGQQGQTVEVTLTGANFVPGATVQVSGGGVIVPAPLVTVVSSTTITAEFTIERDASPGGRSVTVTNPAPGGGTSESRTFTVTEVQNPVPVLTSISPNSGQQLQTVEVTLTGANFVPGATVQVSGGGVTVPSALVTVVNSTTITALFTVAAGASFGGRGVTVTNPAPGGGTSESQTFTVTELFVNKAPTLNPIADVSFLHTAAEQVVNLTGISAGPGENQNLTVSAVAANTQLIQSLSVQYVSPQATGTLRFQNDRRMVGTTTITVKVKDNGGTANGGIDTLVRVFTVNVNLDTNLEPDLSELPDNYELLQNYPNPFNPSTIIPFHLPGRAYVTMGVYDVTGRLRTTLLQQEMGAGRHEVSLDAASFGSGLYLVRMTSEFGIKSKMIMLVK